MLYFFIYFLSPWLRFIEANILIFILHSQVFNAFLNIIVIDSLIVLYHSPNLTNFPVVLYLPFTLVAASPQRKTAKRSKNNIKVKKKIQIKIILKSKKKQQKATTTITTTTTKTFLLLSFLSITSSFVFVTVVIWFAIQKTLLFKQL